MLMRHIVLALCVIVGLVWQTSIFLQVFPNDLLQSLGYSGASLFLASMTLGVGVVTLNAWEQLTGATKTTGVSTGGIFCAAPVFKLIWFPYMEFETTPQDVGIGLVVYVLLVASFSTIRDLVERIPNATSEMSSRELSAWGENTSFSYFRACAWNLGITVISCMAISFSV
jgi:hypothetical protein